MALRPTGLTLIIPLRNSTNVPLHQLAYDIEHIFARVPLYWYVQIRDIVQYESNQHFVLLLADEFDKGLRFQFLTKLIRRQSVFPKRVVKILSD